MVKFVHGGAGSAKPSDQMSLTSVVDKGVSASGMKPKREALTMAAETEEDLRTMMERFGKAWFESDREALNALLSETYTHNDGSGGRSNRESFMRIVEGLKGRLTRLAFRDVQIRLVYGVGIITGYSFIRMAGAGPDAQGEGARLTFTQVWVVREDQWRIEAFQATPSPVSAPQRVEISSIDA
jgi:hypothetical protein